MDSWDTSSFMICVSQGRLAYGALTNIPEISLTRSNKDLLIAYATSPLWVSCSLCCMSPLSVAKADSGSILTNVYGRRKSTQSMTLLHFSQNGNLTMCLKGKGPGYLCYNRYHPSPLRTSIERARSGTGVTKLCPMWSPHPSWHSLTFEQY